MQNTKKMAKKIVSIFTAAMLLLSVFSMNVFAAGYEDLTAGEYTVDASLKCYLFPAMGGVEFGAPLLNDAKVTVEDDGTASMTLSFIKSQVVIMGVTAYTFIDSNFILNYYDGSSWQDITDFTLSSDTSLDSSNTPVNYVDSITFPLSSASDTYQLGLYVNSNMMGTQFGGSDSASYPATITVDWDSAVAIASADETSTGSSNVEYEVEGGYEVKIPATITVDSDTKVGDYEVEAVNFVIPDTAYVTVAADTAGTVSNGTETLAFSNTLESANLTATGNKLDGAVTITDTATAAGSYTGVLNFTINYFAQ